MSTQVYISVGNEGEENIAIINGKNITNSRVDYVALEFYNGYWSVNYDKNNAKWSRLKSKVRSFLFRNKIKMTLKKIRENNAS